MIPSIRDKYNAGYSESIYSKYLSEIWKLTNNEVDFRICETPLFIDETLSQKLQLASKQILTYLTTEEFLHKSKKALPANLSVPNEDAHPIFLQIDFAICADEEGKPIPKLIELQGFPSLYAFQILLDDVNRRFYDIPQGFTSYFNGYTKEPYTELLKQAVLGNQNPENVILLEIDPWKQKTRIDFTLTKKYLGVESVCISEVVQHGNKLFYKKDGIEKPIHRIYNRVIFDELLRKTEIKSGFDFHSELEVEWAGHPNWFFRISKHTLPQIKSEYAPKCFFLSELSEFPNDLEKYVLKPLYSFAGSGVCVDVTKEILDLVHDKENYILQEKVEYLPLIKTPDEYSRAEIRMMFIWLEEPILVNNLLRTSKGKMMGVDFNKGKTWVGSNIVYHP